MVAGFGTLRIAVVVAVVVALLSLSRFGSPARWYDRLSERFLYGVPWGTLITVVGVVSFYLFVQSGFGHWDSPVVVAFRSWSFTYLDGLLAAGFAHASPDHLIGNMMGTVVLAPIVEYAWGHYPPPRATSMGEYTYPPPGETDYQRVQPEGAEWRNRPWVRALLIFPLGVFVVSIVTSVLALGWSLGFSGTVFAFGGFAVVYFPVAAILAMVAFSGVSIVVSVLREPVLRATAGGGAPGPPSWWGVNVQAHLLGFLLGVLLAVALLAYRNERRDPLYVFLATLVFGLTRQLWSLAVSGGDGVFLQQRGIGLVLVIGLTVLIAGIVAVSEDPVPAPLEDIGLIPDRRTLAYLWLAAVGLVAGGLVVALAGTGIGLAGGALFVSSLVILVLPALPVAVPDRIATTPTSQRQALVFVLVAIAILVALPSFAFNTPGMSEDPLSGSNALSVQDYQITYAEEIPHGRIDGNESGVIVVSERRDIWSTAVDKGDLARNGEATTILGGFGWRETVTANRTGWNLEGGDSAYVVHLEHDGTEKRLFASEAATARARITNHTVSITPDGDQFRLRAERANETVATTPIPELNETERLGPLRVSTERSEGSRSVFAHQNGTRVLIATEE